ncbi:MAG TPA: hypothetical protein VFA89_14785 [Terriglobales bacterium]|nr:hypothetical protein [Terriglobales bacterium]
MLRDTSLGQLHNVHLADLGPSDTPVPSLLLPDALYRPLWRSLLAHAHDRLFPEKLPPLLISSRPVDVGILVGDLLSLSWTRTIFTNIGDVISPETLPPLQLESRPVDVGELIADQLSHMWWSSLLRNLADRVSPERLPALQLTSTPINLGSPSDAMILPRWSSLIAVRKLAPGEKPKPTYLPPPHPVLPRPSVALPASTPEVHPKHELQAKRLKTHLSWSRIREIALVSVAIAEALYLVISWIR